MRTISVFALNDGYEVVGHSEHGSNKYNLYIKKQLECYQVTYSEEERDVGKEHREACYTTEHISTGLSIVVKDKEHPDEVD